MREPHTARGEPVNVWRPRPRLRVFVARQRSVRMVVRVNEEDVRTLRGGERRKEYHDQPTEQQQAVHIHFFFFVLPLLPRVADAKARSSSAGRTLEN